MAESGVAPPVARRRRRLVFVAAALLLLAAAWWLRRPVLVAVGSALVTEDPAEPVDVVVVSNTNYRSSALEAVHLYREGRTPRLALLEWHGDRVEVALRREGFRTANSTAQIRSILEQAGIPSSAITVLPGAVDGTGTELAAILAWVQHDPPRSLLYLTARTHTTRARARLRREAPAGLRVLVGAPRYDAFDPGRWWLNRGSTREVMTEYIRWINTFLLGDLWRRRLTPAASPAGGAGAPGGAPAPAPAA